MKSPVFKIRDMRSRLISILTAFIALSCLSVARKGFDIPKPLVVTLGSTFLCWFFIAWWLPSTSRATVARVATYLLLPWATLSLALLSFVYYADRGGWIWYQISGYNEALPEELVNEVILSPAEFVRQNPSFILDSADKTKVRLRRGEYVFSHTIVFPRNSALTIEPGAVVKMGVGCSLISYSPLNACGTNKDPIVFTAANRWSKWGVVGLVSASSALLEHVHFSDARQACVNGTDFPGGLSLIETDGNIRQCRFSNMYGKDAVYVRHSHVTIRDNRVEIAFKDGIDLDESRGEIQGNVLIDCDDEGLDLSDDTIVDVEHNTIRDRHGGRIAANHDLDRIRSANTLEYSRRE